MSKHHSRKAVLIPAEQSGQIWGYSYLLFELSYKNIKAFKKYRKTFNEVRDIDANVTNLTYNNYNFAFTLLTNDFDFGLDYEKPHLVRLSDLGELNLDTTIDMINEPEWRLEKTPYIKVGLHGITFCYYAVGTNDEVYCTFPYEKFEQFLKDL